LKLKTSPQFSLAQFCKIILLTSLAAFNCKAFSQTSSTEENPGLIESLERLLEVHHKQYDQNKSRIQSNLKGVTDLTSLADVKLDPQFVRSLIFHSDDKYLRLIQNDECKLLSSIETNLLKTAEGEISTILIQYKNKDGVLESAAFPREDFFEQIYKKKCLNNREFATLFSEANFQKTIEGIKFPVPKSNNECLSIHKEWLDNSFSPYLCKIQQTIKKSKIQKVVDTYKAKIPTFQRTYLDNLCTNLSDPQSFCENYLKKDIWNKVLNGEAPSYKMSFKCQNISGKASLTAAELKDCAAKLNSEPTLCETRGAKNFPSLFPMANCNLISEALNKSKLATNYHDCPGNVDNEALTNIHRLVNHFSPRSINSNKETCAGEAEYSFARLNFDIKHEEGWPLKVCFMNPVQEKENCVSYIPGSRETEPLSEDQVIAKILYQYKGAPAKTKCRIVDSKTYNPLRSEFKFGCFIVYEAETCTTLSCNKKVIWEEKAIPDIKFVGKPVFEYFPSAFLNERYSFVNMINEVKGTQERTIKNLTDMKFYLDKIPSGIIHGVGCAEDLLTEEFSRTVMNQCHPLPFIIDGYTIKNNETWIVLRASIDDLHSPRLILWQNIFNSVSAYRELHPLNTWTLYGIKK
jgi:hypothetical protein